MLQLSDLARFYLIHVIYKEDVSVYYILSIIICYTVKYIVYIYYP